MKKEFWKDWSNITQLEKKAIKSLVIGKKIILDNIPKDEIISIYAKGSFIRREMNEKSDVDLFTVLRTQRYLRSLKILSKRYKKLYDPQINIGSGYTLYELKTGKKASIKGDNKPAPARVIKHLPHYKLIYGKEVNDLDLFQKDNKILLEKLVKTFNIYFLPNYEKNKITFSEIVKQVFWLVEFEQRALGKNPPHSWKKLKLSIKDKSHIIHDAWKLRNNPTKDEKVKKSFIKSLERYLIRLRNI